MIKIFFKLLISDIENIYVIYFNNNCRSVLIRMFNNKWIEISKFVK